MENITASEVAGLGVGAFLVLATVAAPKIDSLISSSQRSSLGMCRKCGDLKMVACSTCKGTGLAKAGGAPFTFLDDLYQSVGGETEVNRVKCSKCRAKGHFHCPNCSKGQSL
ncbi:unnamed protein product [Linum trigynum]|uniref:Uncharacterized protein n=3 Tax=Linum TaxID=4005 RepID=A0AAV2CPR1_9ROSI